MKFNVDELFVLDLQDDFVMNYDKDLYEFINGDPVKAFYLGWHIEEWFKLLEKDQKYLHSKLVRHNNIDCKPYNKQIDYWVNKFTKGNPEAEIDLLDLSEYIYNNMFWDDKTEDIDKMKVAFFLGGIVGKNVIKEEENEDDKQELKIEFKPE